MKRIVFLIIVLTSFILNLNRIKAQQFDSLENTRWEFLITENFADYIEFKDSFNVIVYSCEIGEKYFGKYSFENDTIKVVTFSGEFDYEFPVNSKHRHKKIEMNFQLQNDTLIYLENKEVKYKKQKNGE